MYAARSEAAVVVATPDAGPYVQPLATCSTGRPPRAASVSGASAPVDATVCHVAGNVTESVSENSSGVAPVEGCIVCEITSVPEPPYS